MRRRFGDSAREEHFPHGRINMTTNRKQVALAALAAFALIGFGQAQAATLKVGDPAPKLQIGKWVQGDPVKEFSPAKAYIVEFWATWCGPCRVSIPHLNEIYQRFKDKGLVVIGQDCFEHDESLVAPFVEKMGNKMTYRVALDDKQGNEKGQMAETWMEAAGQNGIPTAFLVDKHARIAWIGHPMSLQDSVIEQVLAGTYDVKKAAVDFEHRQQAQENYMRFNALLRQGDYPAASKLALELSDAQKDNAELQNGLAWQLATARTDKPRDLELVQTIAKRANDAANGKDASVLDTLARVTFMQGKKDKAIELQQQAIELAQSDLKPQLEKTLTSYKQGKLPGGE
jgi:thiol-disulfide isomerase/thioredoxin